MKINNTDRQPLIPPNARIVDSHGMTIREGYYFAYPRFMGYPINDGNEETIPLIEGICTYFQGDWGLPNMFETFELKKGQHIELIK